MNTTNAGMTRTIPLSFDKSLVLVRRQLSAAGFSVVEEFDISKEPYFELGIARRLCVVLLVDVPVLLFEAIALDRAAAVFLPLHVVVSGDRDISFVHWANPVIASGLRPPAPSRDALRDIYERLDRALSVLQSANSPAADNGRPDGRC